MYKQKHVEGRIVATRSGYRRRWEWTVPSGKRAFDVSAGAAAILVAAPFMAAIAIAVRLTDGSPVIFRQERPGLDERIFTMYKFRTMRGAESHEETWTTDGIRVTKLGAWLRKTSLDELPELINVVKGDMSLVGPRPLLVMYLSKYSPAHQKRHNVRPGVTGLAQVSGRRKLTFGERLELDVKYVDNWSWRLDAQILVRTLLEPFRHGPDESQELHGVDDVGFFPESAMIEPAGSQYS